ncbi:Leucine-responsive regulatory protein [Salinivirga cyanobacteriivorans]|uniref:Leucine-responsive regulatory protein n=1 Tax=Salinivirga cyanobacteriivorans TaxID=1307839 RepID=A0A0S2I244_9BACT|nr:Lrp/AsnC family transcriptional regulator [Salinivirga cyanobacteriivorans]ALO16346.1 Leucine-responsive regulatory protein [Salinivirga cyanobacteriivorans]
MKPIDEIDRKLLNELQVNSRITIRELSEKLHLSTTPIHERIKKLEKGGYIKQYVTLLDPKKFDKKLMVYISVSLRDHAKEAVEAFEQEIEQLDEVMECYYISGSSDFLLKVFCDDMDGFHDFITNKFSTIDNITQFYSSFVMYGSKVKYDFKL